MKVSVCLSCATGREAFVADLATALREAGVNAEVAGIECMSGCRRPSTVAFRSDGKTAYLFGDLSDADLSDLVVFARAYANAPDGNFEDARPLGALRFKALARIPS